MAEEVGYDDSYRINSSYSSERPIVNLGDITAGLRTTLRGTTTKNGKIKGILWWDRCDGGFNCPYQPISLDVKDLHDVDNYGELVVKVHPYTESEDES